VFSGGGGRGGRGGGGGGGKGGAARHKEAVGALGFGWPGRHGFVIVPQAFRRLLPPPISLLVNLIQNTTIAQVIGAPELLESAERQVERLAAPPPIGIGEVEAIPIYAKTEVDEETMLASVAKTGRVVVVQEAPRVCGFAAEVAAVLAERAIFDLHGPVIRVTGYDVPYPYWQIEDAYMPSVERVVDAARRVLAA